MLRTFINVQKRLLSTEQRWIGQSRAYTRNPNSQKYTEEEAKKLADQAKASQNLWDFLVPERNIGVTHPFFLVLLTLTLSLHYYNRYRDAEEDERLRKLRQSRAVASSKPNS
jgi:hypothetical protein